jgi:glycosyltransferase involved in cell wall biosynthesis
MRDGDSSRSASRRIAFLDAQGWERWSPAAIHNTGLGGSETALVRVAAALAACGHPVTVYNDSFDGVVDGVVYRLGDRWDPGDPVDAVVVSRLPELFDHELAAPTRALWCHDAYYNGLTPERAGRMTDVIVLSGWQRDLFARRYPAVAGKLRIVRNGIRLRDDDGRALYEGAERGFGERAPRCIYSSLPNRGLDVLLEVWPEIRRRIPEAQLDVYYGWDVYDQMAEHSHRLRGYKVLLYHLLERAGGEAGGVFMRGRVSQPELHAAMSRARVWSYPTGFPETSCISAMEARAAGLAIVTSDLGALSETVGHDHGVLVRTDERLRQIRFDENQPLLERPNNTPEYRTAFVDAVTELLADADAWTAQHVRALDGVEDLDWSCRVEDWERLLP